MRLRLVGHKVYILSTSVEYMGPLRYVSNYNYALIEIEGRCLALELGHEIG